MPRTRHASINEQERVRQMMVNRIFVLGDIVANHIDEVTYKGVYKGKTSRSVTGRQDGVYYSRSNSGHYKAVVDGQELDSYDLGQQKVGSQGFCQTFACMNFLARGKAPATNPNMEAATKAALEFIIKHSDVLWRDYAGQSRDPKAYCTDYTVENAEDFLEEVRELHGDKKLMSYLDDEHTYYFR